jgi:hypothetical protein
VLMLCFSRQAMAKASLVPNLDPTSECHMGRVGKGGALHWPWSH